MLEEARLSINCANYCYFVGAQQGGKDKSDNTSTITRAGR